MDCGCLKLSAVLRDHVSKDHCPLSIVYDSHEKFSESRVYLRQDKSSWQENVSLHFAQALVRFVAVLLQLKGKTESLLADVTC